MSKNEITKYDTELAELAKLNVQAEKSSGGTQFIATSGGVLKYQDNPIAGNELEVVIISSPIERLYYTARYDPTNSAPPVCFALGTSATGLAPSVLAETPQSVTCDVCPKNQWNSAAGGGKGKACAEKRRLFLVTSDSINTAEDVELAEVAALRIPVTSVKGYSTYVQTIASTLKRPLAAIVTKISLVPDAKTQFKIVFHFVRALDDMAVIKALIAKGASEVDHAIQSPLVEEEPAEATTAAPTSSKY